MTTFDMKESVRSSLHGKNEVKCRGCTCVPVHFTTQIQQIKLVSHTEDILSRSRDNLFLEAYQISDKPFVKINRLFKKKIFNAILTVQHYIF